LQSICKINWNIFFILKLIFYNIQSDII
jgi:hypothetical protein